MTKKKGTRVKNWLSILLLLLVAVSFHWLFLVKDYNLAVNLDAINQFAFFYPHLVESFAAGNFFWSWSYGLGGDLLGEFAYYYTTSPLFYLVVLAEKIFDFEWSILGTVDFKMYLSVLKSFLAMLGMYLLVRYEKFEIWKALVSALVYGSSIIFFAHAALIDYMTEAFLYVPLTIFGLLHYHRTGKSRYFILGIFLSVFSNFYLGFINSTFYGVAAIVLTPVKSKSIVKTYAPFLLHYAIGLGLAFVGFLPGILSVYYSDRLAIKPEIPLFFGTDWFFSLPEQVWGHIGGLGFPFLTVIAVLVIFLPKDTPTKRKSILALLLFVFYFIPYMYSVFNGFSHIQYRWFHILNFAVAFALPNWLTVAMKARKRLLFFVFIAAGLFVGALYTKAERTANVVDLFDIAVAGFGILSLILFYLMSRWKRKSWLAGLIVLAVAGNGVVNVIGYTDKEVVKRFGASNLTDEYFSQPSLDHPEEKEIFSKLVPEQDEFYRTFYLNEDRLNHAMLYGYYGTNAYNSVLKKNLHTFVKKDYNVRQFNPLRNGVVVSTYSLFDGRWALETGLGLKYQILSKQARAPFGYEKIEETATYDVYVNPSAVGLDMWYTDTIFESEWAKLNVAQRDALFLNTLVVPDEYAQGTNDGWKEHLPEEIDVDAEKFIYENASMENGVLIVNQGGKVTLPIEQHREPGEYMVYFDAMPVEDRAMTLSVNGKEVLKRESSYIYSYPNEGYLYRLDGGTKQIEIVLSPGEYELSDVQVYWNSYEEFREQAEQRETHSLGNLHIGSNRISGEFSTGQQGILFLSIPFSEQWKLEVNGKETELLEVQGAFSGVLLEPGNYQIELSYITPGFYWGLLVTAVSALAALLLYLNGRRKVE
ncbi:YfhO family protein [Planococcus shenhongbingii]|uniref:YfhO family protein n=1 Tax=Planococcus shenhongbingii TaxID=3058398 RepID=A0ABT8N9J9_9BACL|nr:YfhO family protein [Planococcus sp. N017]MDN7244570.1 YfhO family protein [Planococcus sp. N017]